MGGKGGAKVPISKYNMSLHLGFCAGPVDAIKEIWIGEKKAWEGDVRSNVVIQVENQNLFGGIKKEGGVSGIVEMMFGKVDQLVSAALAGRLGRTGPDDCPGYRGITSLFFRGNTGAKGFYWSASNPYLKEVWLRASRCPRDLDANTAIIYDTPSTGVSMLHQATDGPVWGNTTPIQIVSAGSWGFVVGDLVTKNAWRFDANGHYLGTTTAIPGIPTVRPSGFTYMDTIGGADIFYKKTDATISSASCIQVGTGSVTSPFVDISNNLPGAEKLLGIIPSREAGCFMVFTRTGANSITVSGPGRWYIMNPTGAILAKGDIALTGPYASGVSHSSFGWGNYCTDVWAAGCLSPDLSTVWNANGTGTMDVNVWARTDDSTLSFVSRIEYALSPAGAFSFPTIWATKDGAYAASTTASLSMTATFTKGHSGRENANPAHIIYECLTNTDWGMGADPGSIDTAAFVAAAQTLYNEQFGVFMQWTSSSPIEDFVNEVLEHIKGALFTNPRTGKQSIRLLRDDYDIDDLEHINPQNAALSNFARRGWGETSNEVVVTWTSPDSEKEETVSSQDLGNIATQGTLISNSRNYYGVRTAALAQKLADRELRSSSASLCSCEATVDRSFWDVTPYECVILDWPEYGVTGMVMRVMTIDYGKTGDSSIKLSLVEDVFALPFASFVPPAESQYVPPSEEPVPVTAARLIPLPAYVVSQSTGDLSSLMYPATRMSMLAENPTPLGTARYDVQTPEVSPSGAISWEYAGFSQDFDDRGTLSAPLVAEVTSTFVPPFTGAAAFADCFVIIGPDAAAADELELALVSAADPVTGALTLTRGVLDTIPKAWPTGTPVWVTDVDRFDTVPGDYTEGQTASAKVITITPTGATNDAIAPIITTTALARPTLPLRPGNVKLNGVLWPVPGSQIDGDVTLTWAHRNRFLEDGAVLKWDAASISPEAGVTYTAQMVRTDTEAVVASATGITGTTATLSATYAGQVRVELFAVRDGEISWQTWSLTYLRGIEPLTTEDGESLTTEDDEVIIVETP